MYDVVSKKLFSKNYSIFKTSLVFSIINEGETPSGIDICSSPLHGAVSSQQIGVCIPDEFL
jgi:hypothetical protein